MATMALTPDERAELEKWLAELNREMDELARRVRALTTAIRVGDPQTERQPPAD